MRRHAVTPPPPARPRFCKKCEVFAMPAAVPCWANARFAGFALVCRHCGSVISPGRPPDPESERTPSSQKVTTVSLEGTEPEETPSPPAGTTPAPSGQESERTQSFQKVTTLSLEGEGTGEGVTPSPEVRKNADPD